MLKRIEFKILLVQTLAVFIFSFLFLPLAYAQVPSSETEALKKAIEGLQKQLQIQGAEIASLKNQLQERAGPKPVYIVPKDQEAFKQSVWDIVREFRLSEREETPEDKQLRTIYDDGFYLKGKDDTLKIGGWWQGDAIFYDRGNEGNSRFRNRRVRLDIRGVLEEYFEYRLFTQFAGATANLQEAWLMYKYFPSARIKFGQFKVPFSLESQYSALWTDFIEKSMGVANLEPAEDLGLMIYGNPFGGRLEYATGIFNGRARTLEDNNDNFDVAGRLVLAPFLKLENNLVREFYIGGSFTQGHSDETLAGTGFTTAGGSRFVTYAANVRHADERSRFGGELQWIYGPGDIKAEYVASRFNDVEQLSLKDDIDVSSWYVSGSYMVTGERKIRDKWMVPKTPFSIKDGGWGAWEVAVRFEQFLLDDSPFTNNFLSGTDRVDAYSLGLNWTPNKHIRFMFNYVLNDFDEPVLLGGESQDSEHLWLGRAQYNF